jgi:hypothetical protein
MKKLILYDHNGQKVGEHDVYVEGSDFEWVSPQPVAVWFGRILLVDKEPEAEEVEEQATLEKEVAEEKDYNQKVLEGEDKIVSCYGCGWKGLESKADFGHDDFICPECGYQRLEEVKDSELEKADNQSTGDRGTGEAEQHEGTENVPEKPAGEPAKKRDKRLRKRKAT